MKFKRIGIDIAKNVFQLHGVDENDEVIVKKKLSRQQFLRFLKTKVNPEALIAMESCSGSHHWGRELTQYGFDVHLIPAQYVKPYLKRNKNDANDAEAICEAASRPGMPKVPIKTIEQQDIQAMHRARSELVKQRTATANQIRGLVTEYGLVASQSLTALKKTIPQWLEDAENGLSELFRRLLNNLYEHLNVIDQQIKHIENEIKQLSANIDMAVKLQTLPGIGVLTATALIAAIGDGKQFKNGRCLSAWLGLTPKQHSSGGKDVLFGISKAGDSYVRTLFIHGARAVVNTADKRKNKMSDWINKLKQSHHNNVVAVAVANKNARIAWAMLTNQTEFDGNQV